MALSVLYIGGTGQISPPCVEASLAAGHDVTILNRGKTAARLPKGVKTLAGDMNGVAYGELGDRRFDVVAQFRLYTPDQMKRDIATFTGKTGQYVFVSSASVYEKPVRHYLMTERTRLENIYWQYSRDKIACERTAARPGQARLHHRASEPYGAHRHAHPGRRSRWRRPADARRKAGDRRRRRLVAMDAHARRRRREAVRAPASEIRPRSTTTSTSRRIAVSPGTKSTRRSRAGFGVEAIHAHVPTETLVRFNEEWVGPLLGDKTWSALFDNAKVKRVAGLVRGLGGHRRDPALTRFIMRKSG